MYERKEKDKEKNKQKDKKAVEEREGQEGKEHE